MRITVGTEVIVLTSNAEALDAVAGHEMATGWLTMDPGHFGRVLRKIHLYRPLAVLVHVGDSSQIKTSSILIKQLRRRFPKLPLVAFTQQHSDPLEQAVRAAGATCYVPRFPEPEFVSSLQNTSGVARMGLKSADNPAPVSARSHSPPARCHGPPQNEKPH
jgi:hypothetical protein